MTSPRLYTPAGYGWYAPVKQLGMTMNDEPVDLMKPWTIKSVSTRVANGINAASRRENLTVGQWLEKRFDEWEGAGSPERREAAPLDLAGLLNAAAAFAAVSKLPREVRMLIADTARHARGLPSRKPGPTMQIEAE